MRSGLLRKRVTIQVQKTVGSLQKWVTFGRGPIWAAVDPVSGVEVARSLSPSTVAMSNVTIRYQPGILPKMRIVFGVRILEISSVINLDERNRELDLVCREVVN